MSDITNLDLTPRQRDLVLEGLRYVRSSRRLAFRDPLAPRDENRDAELRLVGELLTQLEPKSPVAARADA
jgi:hypothetical protein